ncbi:MAG TPA: SDR family NAD(P)-dependent oxidoreductase [Acidimicrobiales bacterium]|jgi:benzil reductase ((S)-benzoin forming)|nr:SDR family NAD(P)-dependent oxidoreductase [Acidimicrobiales bacterium]
MDTYAGRVAVITGASRGLGAGLAARFAEVGFRLGLCARTQPRASFESVDPPECASVDVTDHAAVKRFCDRVVDRFGQIDLWVNNAGLLHPIGPLRSADPEDAARLMAVNVTGVMHATAVFADHVRSHPGGGVLINMSSGAATTPYAGWAPYCASKAAVDQLTRTVALEEREHGLAAYAVSPGLVDTDMQALIRSTTPENFPAVDRFLQIKESDAFNSPAWVADQLLALAFAVPAPDQVVVRIPDQPAPGRAQ